MKVRSLHVSGFRALGNLSFRPGGGMNAFWGDNAQGKTSLLEAIYAALRARSFRPYATKADWIPRGVDNGTQVQISLDDHRGFEIQAEALRAAGSQHWDFRLDGKKASSAQLRSRLSVVVFSPDDHAIIRGGPELRREYLDDVFCDVCPGYTETLERFERSLKSRNVLLKKDAPSLEEVNSWTNVLAEVSAQLANLRREIFPEFREFFLRIGEELFSKFPEKLSIDLESNVPDPLSRVYEAGDFIAAFRASWEADKATGWTHRGPQRDDFLVKLGTIDARHGFSQGQSRLMALVLRWVHASWVARQRRETPLFLMDDFSSELDAVRRSQLLQLIRGLEGQIFLTGTDPRMVDSEALSEYTGYNVFGGLLTSV